MLSQSDWPPMIPSLHRSSSAARASRARPGPCSVDQLGRNGRLSVRGAQSCLLLSATLHTLSGELRTWRDIKARGRIFFTARRGRRHSDYEHSREPTLTGRPLRAMVIPEASARARGNLHREAPMLPRAAACHRTSAVRIVLRNTRLSRSRTLAAAEQHAQLI